MKIPTTGTGRLVDEHVTDGTIDVHAAVLAIEDEARRQVFEGLRGRAKDHHTAMSHEGNFGVCDHGTCVQFRWLLEPDGS